MIPACCLQTTFGIEGAQARGNMFIKPGDDVYKGMIVGIHQRPGDLEVNVCNAKALNNIRYVHELS